MRSAKNNLREAEDSVSAPPASTGVHRCRPFAVLEVSYFTAIAGLASRSGPRPQLSACPGSRPVYTGPQTSKRVVTIRVSTLGYRSPTPATVFNGKSNRPRGALRPRATSTCRSCPSQ